MKILCPLLLLSLTAFTPLEESARLVCRATNPRGGTLTVATEVVRSPTGYRITSPIFVDNAGSGWDSPLHVQLPATYGKVFDGVDADGHPTLTLRYEDVLKKPALTWVHRPNVTAGDAVEMDMAFQNFYLSLVGRPAGRVDTRLPVRTTADCGFDRM